MSTDLELETMFRAIILAICPVKRAGNIEESIYRVMIEMRVAPFSETLQIAINSD